jgi:hypothetical protein
MLKSEYARQQLKTYLSAAAAPITIDSLIDNVWLFTDDGDPRWLGAAVSHFDGTGELRHVTCDANHQHTSECTVEWVGA